jgi:hypothetical protein
MLNKIWMWTLLRNTTCHFWELCYYYPCTCYQLGTNLFKSFSCRGRALNSFQILKAIRRNSILSPNPMQQFACIVQICNQLLVPWTINHKKMGAHVLNSNECTPTLNFQNTQNIQNEWMINQKEERCIWNMHEPN